MPCDQRGIDRLTEAFGFWNLIREALPSHAGYHAGSYAAAWILQLMQKADADKHWAQQEVSIKQSLALDALPTEELLAHWFQELDTSSIEALWRINRAFIAWCFRKKSNGLIKCFWEETPYPDQEPLSMEPPLYCYLLWTEAFVAALHLSLTQQDLEAQKASALAAMLAESHELWKGTKAYFYADATTLKLHVDRIAPYSDLHEMESPIASAREASTRWQQWRVHITVPVERRGRSLQAGYALGVLAYNLLQAQRAGDAATDSETATVCVRDFEVTNKLGIHARPAAMIVRIANKYSDVDLWIEKDQERVNAKSIMGVMTLAAGRGSRLRFTATGKQAEALLDEMNDLFKLNFEGA